MNCIYSYLGSAICFVVSLQARLSEGKFKITSYIIQMMPLFKYHLKLARSQFHLVQCICYLLYTEK